MLSLVEQWEYLVFSFPRNPSIIKTSLSVQHTDHRLSVMESCYCRNLPNDLLTEILARLPVKSLLQFKSVCKNWYSLITSSCFVTKHFHHKENPTRPLILLCDRHFDPIIYVLPEKILPELEKPSYLQIPATYTDNIGPVNGLFFLRQDLDHMALWNPATREFKHVPLDFFQSHLGESFPIFGFGYDPISQDYKVVCIWLLCDEEYNPRRVGFASVYSLGKDCWREVACNFDAKPLMKTHSLNSTCVNGFYYWCADHNEKDLFIRFFDMHNEVFGEIPWHHDLSRGDDCKLTIYNESICLLVRHCDLGDDNNPPIDVWLMDNERVWNKVLNVTPTRIELLSVVPKICYCIPLGFWGHDKFIFISSTEDGIKLYDSKNQKFTHLYNIKEDEICISALSYRESLVSITGKIVSHKQGNISDLNLSRLRIE